MKWKQQLLQANQEALNDKWVKILSAKQDLKERRHSAPKSYPHRRLLPEFDEVLTDDVLLTRGQADEPDRPPRGRDRPVRENFHTQTMTRYHSKDSVVHLKPYDA
jgi:hypothetical protein